MYKTWPYLLCLLMSTSSTALAQSLERYVLSTGGQSNQTNDIQLDWTLGQIMDQTYTYQDGMLTEGFHQPRIIIETSRSKLPILSNKPGLEINVSPNPAKSIIEISFSRKRQAKGQLQLINTAGQILKQQQISPDLIYLELDLSAYPSGMYLLRYSNSDEKLLNSFKVQKI